MNNINNHMSLVSIGMPVFNGEKFIHEAINSLLSQTFTDFELIISDNASTDKTEAICREYEKKDKRIRYVRQKENIGVIANFKYVLDQSAGEYFMWAAADDVWGKTWIKALLPISTKMQCLAYGRLITINNEGLEIKHSANFRKFDYSGWVFLRRLKYFMEPSFLGKANPIYGIYPKKLLSADLLMQLSSGCSGDMLFLYKLLEFFEIKGGTNVFIYKRIHSECAGGEHVSNDSKISNILINAFRVLLRMLSIQSQQLIEYSAISNRLEKFIFKLGMPINFIIYLFYSVIYNPRLRKLIGN
jgi:glycosyltransferase involved in cell wall biosynthesis